mmetsp:Transcript_42061/g.42651  ORF Transcript_42061/g.42651 Transcript_42061/m.42651 type:complete len:135 (-) Transcript_42061:63-467(-)
MIVNYPQQQEQKQPETNNNIDSGEVSIFKENLFSSLQLHPGCIYILKRQAATSNINNNNDNNRRIGVLSINWCPILIAVVLLHPLCDKISEIASSSSLPPLRFEDIPIWRNIIDENGVVSPLVTGAVAKKERIV